MAKDRDEETGKYVESYPFEEFTEALKTLDGAGSTQEIANEVECAYRTAHAKLTQLEDEGDISSQKVGNAKLWELNE
ncbi:ArsR family transcriptional regulator [Natrarchaeobaculum sulfurireducens]|uniref:ArsR family transcriptional regulator n=1 Tax=Natrarchaeobaculum sulfurireducens TaxID=2044521 RepID=UPI000E3D9E43|nr:ArsR family transcriptional regulator [Natrarchaeobaculum sulfurireducens]